MGRTDANQLNARNGYAGTRRDLPRSFRRCAITFAPDVTVPPRREFQVADLRRFRPGILLNDACEL